MVTIIPLHTTDFCHVLYDILTFITRYGVYLTRWDPIRYIAHLCLLCALIVQDCKCNLEFQVNDSIFPMPDNLDGNSTIIFSMNTYQMRSLFLHHYPYTVNRHLPLYCHLWYRVARNVLWCSRAFHFWVSKFDPVRTDSTWSQCSGQIEASMSGRFRSARAAHPCPKFRP